MTAITAAEASTQAQAATRGAGIAGIAALGDLDFTLTRNHAGDPHFFLGLNRHANCARRLDRHLAGLPRAILLDALRGLAAIAANLNLLFTNFRAADFDL